MENVLAEETLKLEASVPLLKKTHTTLYVDPTLLQQAKDRKINLSKTLSDALRIRLDLETHNLEDIEAKKAELKHKLAYLESESTKAQELEKQDKVVAEKAYKKQQLDALKRIRKDCLLAQDMSKFNYACRKFGQYFGLDFASVVALAESRGDY